MAISTVNGIKKLHMRIVFLFVLLSYHQRESFLSSPARSCIEKTLGSHLMRQFNMTLFHRKEFSYPIPSKQIQINVVVRVSLLLTLNIFHTFFHLFSLSLTLNCKMFAKKYVRKRTYLWKLRYVENRRNKVCIYTVARNILSRVFLFWGGIHNHCFDLRQPTLFQKSIYFSI